MEHIKITDLSIGNWVEYDREHYRVIQIDEESEHVLISGLSGVRDKHIDYIEPICIKPEMLKKNGFIKENRAYKWSDEKYRVFVWLKKFSHFVDVVEMDKQFAVRNSCIEVKKLHVHQLQNTLRLAGIDKEIEL